MDLRCVALDVAPLLAGLKVLPPASVWHLPVQQELTSFLHLHTHIPGNRGHSSVIKSVSWEFMKVLCGLVCLSWVKKDVHGLVWNFRDQCLELLLILVDVTHTSEGFKAKPYSIREAHSPGPEHEHKLISSHYAWPVHEVGYQVVQQQL